MRQFTSSRPLVAGALILLATTSLRAEGCTRFFHFNLNSEGPWPAYMNVKAGGHCGGGYWRAGGTTSFGTLYLVAAPKHGAVHLLPHAHYVYSPNSGYVGADSFTLRVCGTTQSRPGCANLLFHVTVR